MWRLGADREAGTGPLVVLLHGFPEFCRRLDHWLGFRS
jgi:hypothetical protein